MTEKFTVNVPDIGDFDKVPVIEVLVSSGEEVTEEQALVTLESDKATLDIPSPAAGIVGAIHIALGDDVSMGDALLDIEITVSAAAETEQKPAVAKAETVAPTSPVTAVQSSANGNNDYDFDVAVIGSGPGGYTAAFRAADLGLKVVMIEKHQRIGGVCLNVGCIPSKALLHAAKVIDESADAVNFGLTYNEPEIDIDKLRDWKGGIVSSLTGGLTGLAKQRKVEVVQGTAHFSNDHTLDVTTDSGVRHISFKNAIIAAGSTAIQIPSFPNDDERMIDSTGALELKDIPPSLLVIGGGIIGLEMATVYHALGSKISVVEMADRLVNGADADIVKPLHRRIEKHYESIWLKTRVTKIEPEADGLRVHFEGDKAPKSVVFDKVLMAVGRSANGGKISAENAGVAVDERGFIAVDKQQRTNVPHIFAIGDLVGQPMLAHKAVHEGKVAAEVAAGLKSGFEATVIPSVAYTDPEIAWVGVTEEEAKADGLNFGKGVFPWAASGRSLSINRKEGITKVLFDEDTKRIIGCGIVGPHAGDLIAEATLAIEMGADAEDIGLTIHPHPTLSETVGFAAEAFEGTITDLYMPKKKK